MATTTRVLASVLSLVFALPCAAEDSPPYNGKVFLDIGGNDYHGGKSLSLFLDADGGEDSYPKRANDKIVFGGENSIFVDAPGEFAELAGGALRRGLAQPEPEG